LTAGVSQPGEAGVSTVGAAGGSQTRAAGGLVAGFAGGSPPGGGAPGATAAWELQVPANAIALGREKIAEEKPVRVYLCVPDDSKNSVCCLLQRKARALCLYHASVIVKSL
jgi:hypothetical protein